MTEANLLLSSGPDSPGVQGGVQTEGDSTPKHTVDLKSDSRRTIDRIFSWILTINPFSTVYLSGLKSLTLLNAGVFRVQVRSRRDRSPGLSRDSRSRVPHGPHV